MSILGRYVSGRILMRFLIILLAATAFGVSFELMDRADNVLYATDDNRWALLAYALLRAPGLMVDLFSITVLLASLFALGDLLRHRELAMTWGMGMSPLRLVGELLPLAVALGMVFAALNEAAIPRAAERLAGMGLDDPRGGLLNSAAEAPLWFRRDRDIVRIARNGGEPLGAVSIFRLDATATLVERLDARRLETTDQGWRLREVVRRDVAHNDVIELDELAWSPKLEPEHLDLLAADARNLPVADLMRVLALGNTASRPVSLYETWLMHRLVGPLMPALMIVLSVAIAQRYRRTDALARLVIAGGAAGIGFFVLDGAAVALGEVDLIPPWLAAPGASLILFGFIIHLFVVGRKLRG